MPLPPSLIGPALITGGGLLRRRDQITSDPEALARALSERAGLSARCEWTLDLLDEQRRAVLEGTIPRLEAMWARIADADEAVRRIYEERLATFGADLPHAPDIRHEHAAVIAPISCEPPELAVVLGGNVRLEAVIAASTRALEALAHMRARLSAQCRRLSDLAAESSIESWPLDARRTLAGTGSLAGAAAGLALLQVISSDGGIDRRFAAALLQV